MPKSVTCILSADGRKAELNAPQDGGMNANMIAIPG